MIKGNFGCELEKIKSKPGDLVLNVDIRGMDKGCNFICDLSLTLPFKDNSFDYIYSSHTVEHFSYIKVIDILKEWQRVLKVDGEIELVVPSFEYVVEKYLDSKEIPIAELYGGQNHPHDFHLNVFDAKRLADYMRQAGFSEIKVDRQDFWGRRNLSLKAIGRKKLDFNN